MYSVIFWNIQSSLLVGDMDLCRRPGACPEQRASEVDVWEMKGYMKTFKDMFDEFFCQVQNSVHCFS